MVGGFQPALVNGRGDLAPTITDNFTQMSTRPSSIKDIVEFAHDDIKYPVIRVIGHLYLFLSEEHF